MLHHHTRLPSITTTTTTAYALFTPSINLLSTRFNRPLPPCNHHPFHLYHATATTDLGSYQPHLIHPTMNATKILQAGRQPMIRFLGKRTTPSRTWYLFIDAYSMANGYIQISTTLLRPTQPLQLTRFLSPSPATARRHSSTAL